MNTAVAIYARLNGTEPELASDLRQIVETNGDTVGGTFIDDTRIEGKGRNRAWNRLLTSLDQVHQIVLADPGDFPGTSEKHLLTILETLTEHGVTVLLPRLGIDTSTGSAAVLDLIQAYRSAKLSQAIRRGQERARKAGRKIGRPAIPTNVRRRILADLNAGAGVRMTARRFNVSPATVINVRRTMPVLSPDLAA